MDIEHISTDELIVDLKELLDDVFSCLWVLGLGIDKAKEGGDIRDRMNTDKEVIGKIFDELKRRTSV